jgi:aminopeptidase N
VHFVPYIWHFIDFYMQKIGLWMLVVVLLGACASSRKATTKKDVGLDTIRVSAAHNPMELYRAVSEKKWELDRTHVALTFDWKGKTATGEAHITLHPYCYATDSRTLDAKSMRIDSVLVLTGSTKHPLAFTYGQNRLHIRLGHTYTRHDTLDLLVQYKALPYEAPSGGSDAIQDDRGLYFINTDYAVPNKPAQIWTQGETEANSHWMPTLDKPNQRTRLQISLTVPDSFATLSNGKLISSVPAPNGQRVDVWRMDERIQVYAAMFAIGRFSITQDKWQGKDVNYYVEPAYAPYAAQMFAHTPEMIQFFSDITGVPYPWNKYSQITVRDYVSGAMENTTATLLGEFTNKNSRQLADASNEDIVAHELFHQWFGDYVTAASWSNITVNESFANYSEILWHRYKYGQADADYYYLHNLSGYLNSAKYSDQPLVRYHYQNHEDVFDRVSYNKGGSILRYLNGLTGDSAFYKAMNLYLTRNALSAATARHWQQAVEEATGQDWNWFFAQWYYKGGYPALDVRYQYEDSLQMLTVTVQQTQDSEAYILPFKTALLYGSQERILTDWKLTTKTTRFTYPYKNGVRPLIIPDVYRWVVGTWTENKTPEQYLAQYKLSPDFLSKWRAWKAGLNTRNDSNTVELIGLALQDTMPKLRENMLLALEAENSEAVRNKWKRKILWMAENDGSNPVRAAAFQVAGSWQLKTVLPAMLDAVHDSSYAVAGEALAAIAQIDSDKAYTLAKDLQTTNPQGELRKAILDILSIRGNPNDLPVFEAALWRVSARDKFDWAKAMAAFARNTQDEAAFERSLTALQTMIRYESIRDYRLGLGDYVNTLAKDYAAQGKKDPKTAWRTQRAQAAMQQIIETEPDKATQTKLEKLRDQGK